MLAAEATQVQGELPTELGDARTRWFSDRGSVVEDGDERLVFVGGSLIRKFDVRDSPARNVLLVNLLANKAQHIGRLARAVGMGESTLYSIRARYEREGLEAIVRVNKSPIYRPKLNARQRRNIEAMFDRGRGVADVLKHVEKNYGSKRTTVYTIRRASTRASARRHGPPGLHPPSR